MKPQPCCGLTYGEAHVAQSQGQPWPKPSGNRTLVNLEVALPQPRLQTGPQPPLTADGSPGGLCEPQALLCARDSRLTDYEIIICVLV